ncbi:hypothetical protein FPY71_11515 [Aureimonas fodinaquatilis]|uniref:Uncharacterized protein n=1 Tax=Aureimonas fodinaquatilis TaxID=2565783 RepID=A0A5B0DX39_9HYPH|nr:hypothetical protein [Aureimonas fodinaquatilis]KAA0971066.1 hypothetical protein FPY71_11515 [Aureimonas fodinaquatilis]
MTITHNKLVMVASQPGSNVMETSSPKAKPTGRVRLRIKRQKHWAEQAPWLAYLRWEDSANSLSFQANVPVSPTGSAAYLLPGETFSAMLCRSGASGAPAMLPLPGMVVNGRRYRGGNPAQKDNWPLLN